MMRFNKKSSYPILAGVVFLIVLVFTAWATISTSSAASDNIPLPEDDPANPGSSKPVLVSGSDAIAIRIIPNPNRYTAREWYDLQGFSGSPQSMVVDGYDAIRDGRTVYVSAANVDVASNQIQSNIYLISYNQTSDVSTIDIFGKLLSHWKFNNNINISGACNISTLDCSENSDCPTKYECLNNRCQLNSANTVGCLSDSECPLGLFCSSQKSKIIRDIRRSNSLSILRNGVEAYHQQKGVYPNLSAGTYLSGVALSVWPSWNNFLSDLGLPALSDPINKIGVCSGYDKTTCWNAQQKSFYGNSSAANLTLPAGSSIVSYIAAPTGGSYNVCSSMETTYTFTKGESLAASACKMAVATGSGIASTTVNRAPVFVAPSDNNLLAESGLAFSSFVKAVDPDGDMLRLSFPGSTCGLSLAPTSDPNQYKLTGTLTGAGDCNFNLLANDTRGSSTSKVFKVTTTNLPPKITAEDVTYMLGTGKTFDYNIYFEDGNLADAAGNIKGYSVDKKSPTNVSIVNKSLVVTKLADTKYQLNVKFDVAGTITQDTDLLLNVSVTDQSNLSANSDFIVRLIANPPKISFTCPKRLNVDDVFLCQINNENPLANVFYNVSGIPTESGFSFDDSTGLFSGNPRKGVYKLKITATNTNGAVDKAEYNFEVVEEKCGKILIKSPGGPWNQDGTIQNGGGYYKTAVFGDQCWFTNELRDSQDWQKPLLKGANNYIPNFVGDCPAGFHIPTDNEWYKLESYLNTVECVPSVEQSCPQPAPCSGTRTGVGCASAGPKIAKQFNLLFAGSATGLYTTESFWSTTAKTDNTTLMWARSFTHNVAGINRLTINRNTSGPVQLCLRNSGYTYCGDGVRQDQNIAKTGGPNNDGKESCDGYDLNNQACTGLKNTYGFYFSGGDVSCDSACKFYTNDCFCTPVWGPDPATKCGTFTQSDNCGQTRLISGTKNCDDGNPCTVDSCVSNECKNVPSALGTVCGTCKVCNGSGSCMANKQPAPIYAANACVCDPSEVCCNSDGKTFKAAATVCRASLGDCDNTETCSGSSATCPADTFKAASTVCRAAVDVCDSAESCTGITAYCPGDLKKTAGTVCRAAVAGGCDVAETCNGSLNTCPNNSFATAGATCRPATDLCDNAEICSGSSATCPSDSMKAAGASCRAASDLCDIAEVCSGSSKVCPNDAVRAAGYTCRAAVGACDNEETCNGSAKSCPGDVYKVVNTVCRTSTGSCDPQEVCTGNTGYCPTDIVTPATTVCRASAGVCDLADTCSGSGGGCPSDHFVAAGTTCRAASGDCDAPEVCSGSAATCPTVDVYQPSTYDVGTCKKCTGTSKNSLYQTASEDLFNDCPTPVSPSCYNGNCNGSGSCFRYMDYASHPYCTSPKRCIPPGTCCTPESQAIACGLKECGEADNGCGSSISCGVCPTGSVCTVSGTCYCFLAGTKITMTDASLKNIEDVEVGDFVRSYDIMNNKIVNNKVTEIFHHPADNSNGYLVVNGFLKVTPNHRILVNGYWMEIGLAKIGDVLKTEQGYKIITSVEHFDEKVPTYNFEVENTHTYYADGVLVHNQKAAQQ